MLKKLVHIFTNMLCLISVFRTICDRMAVTTD